MGRRLKYVLMTALLATALVAAESVRAQQSGLKFDRTEWNFGSIRESDGSVTHRFEFTNNSSKPIVIERVVGSCGCTTSDFSRKPILSGERGSIEIKFDPTNRPGTFDKDITVYTGGGRNRDHLRIKGFVIERTKTVEELYPIDMAGGLRFDETFLPFSYITQGTSRTMTIKYANTSPHAVRLDVKPLSRSGFLKCEFPKVVAAGAKGEIEFTYSVPVSSGFFGLLNDSFELSITGGEALRISTTGISVEEFKSRNRTESPAARIDKQVLKFDELSRRGKPLTLATTLYNDGHAPLIIRSVQPSVEGVSISVRPGDRVEAGGSVELKVTIVPSKIPVGRMIERVTLVMNDPLRPMRHIRVTGLMVD